MRYVRFGNMNRLVDNLLLSGDNTPSATFYSTITGLNIERLTFVTNGKLTNLLEELDSVFDILDRTEDEILESDREYEAIKSECPIMVSAEALFDKDNEDSEHILKAGIMNSTMAKYGEEVMTLGLYFIYIENIKEFADRYGQTGADKLESLYKKTITILSNNIGHDEKIVLRHNDAMITGEFMIAIWGDKSKVDRLLELLVKTIEKEKR